MRQKRTITGATLKTNRAGSTLVLLRLACGHTAVRPYRTGQANEKGEVTFGARRLRCRECPPK